MESQMPKELREMFGKLPEELKTDVGALYGNKAKLEGALVNIRDNETKEALPFLKHLVISGRERGLRESILNTIARMREPRDKRAHETLKNIRSYLRKTGNWNPPKTNPTECALYHYDPVEEESAFGWLRFALLENSTLPIDEIKNRIEQGRCGPRLLPQYRPTDYPISGAAD